MSRLLNSLFILLCVIINISCGFIDLRQIRFYIEPGAADSILPHSDSPVIIHFDTEMIKKDTEGIMQISSDSGTVRGDKFWKEKALCFVPVSGWTAGVRYTLSLNGTVRSTDGRDLRVEEYVSFYAINKNSPPVLESFSPLNGDSVSANNVIFEFCFSRSMDRLSVESALSLDGIGSKIFEWSADNLVLKVIPEKSLSPWIVYNWNIKESAKSIDGVPLLRSYQGFFKTDIDNTLPRVLNIFPVVYEDGRWYPTGACIETGLGIGQGIAVEFNKKMGESALRSIRFEPSLAGRVEFLSETCIVYIFSKTPEPLTYTLIISGDTKDNEGLKTGSDYKIYFTPDIPVLKIISLSTSGIINNTVPQSNTVQQSGTALPVYIDPAAGYLNISFHFSLMFSHEEKKNAPQRITLNPFFPRTIAPAAVQFVSWISDDRLFMRWEGLSCGGENAPHYYILTIPGGKGGIKADQDIYMEEDIIFYITALPAYASEAVK